jgi:hypothetical protein
VDLILDAVRILAIPSLFVAPFAVMVAIGMAREGNAIGAIKAGSLAAATGLILLIGFSNPDARPRGGGDNCYTDWDGRSNSTVCD